MYGSTEAVGLVKHASEQWRTNHRAEAFKLLEQGYRDALRRRHPFAAFWFLIGLGGLHYAVYDYRQTLDYYLMARDTAIKAGLYPQASIALTSLASLYLHVFDTASALSAIEEAHRYLPPAGDSPQRNQVLMVFGRILSMRGEATRAAPLFEQVIESTSRRDEPREEALAWDHMGWELLRSGTLDRAELALNNAFRLRLFHHDPSLFITEHHLARLYLAKGNLDLARYSIDAAFSWPHHDRTELPEHWLYLTRAEILRAQGDLEGSFQDYLRAIAAMDDWRMRGLAADTFRIRADIFLDEIYNGAIDVAVDLYQHSGDRRFAELAWQFTERVRAKSLRDQLERGHEWTQRLPSGYWSTLDRLREVNADEFAATDRPSPCGSSEAARLRMELAEMEARASAPPANAAALPPHLSAAPGGSSGENLLNRNSLTHVRAVLGNLRTLISFHVGERRSYRWLIAGDRFELKLLPGRKELRRDIDGLRSALVNSTGPVAPAAQKVYLDLLSGLPERGIGDRWCLALDRDLLELPIAALVTEVRDNRPVYLIEERTIEVVPAAWAIEPSPGPPREGFLGIGDGIYNSADPRYRAATPAGWQWIGPFAGLLRKSPNGMELPRLVGSRAEVENCARLARGPTKILMGTTATRRELISALDSKPGVVHVAAHFLTGRTEEKTTAIALGLKRENGGGTRLEILTPDEIASLGVPGSIVVLSGCSSGTGRIVPVAGLLGLARAWMAAGASAVIATHWPTPDDTGDLFAKFYAHLRDSDSGGGVTPAEALRRAQVDILRSAGPRADPSYWAAYEILGRSN